MKNIKAVTQKQYNTFTKISNLKYRLLFLLQKSVKMHRKEWTEEKKNKLLELLNKPYISRFSVLGGEPLAKQNMQDICKLCKEIKDKFPEKKIWLYSGYQYESLSREQFKVLLFVDVLVDGRYDETLKNPSLKFRGSSNQRVINLPETLKQNKVILYCD